MTTTPLPRGFDAHTHLDFPVFDPDREEVCRRARQAGVDSWIIAGADPRAWSRIIRCAESTKGYAVLGIHPWYVPTLSDSEIDDALSRLRIDCSTYGLGELGLDYVKAKTPKERARQQHVFRAQLTIAQEYNVPLILHCVRAHQDLFAILNETGTPSRGGMIHGWSGSLEQLHEALKLNLSISFSSLVFRSPKVAKAAVAVPLERLLIETDSPDQPITPGQRNEPVALIAIAKHLASLRSITPAQLLKHTTQNAIRLFGLES